MSAVVPSITDVQEPRRESARGRSILIATLNRREGITGVHTHTRALEEGLRNLGAACDVVGPFSGNPLWTGVFAARPLLSRLNPRAGLLWYRSWHRMALEANLARRCRSKAPDTILAQCPVSAAAALRVRRKLGLTCRIAMVCHFNHSEAREYRDMGSLPSEDAYRRMLAFEQRVLSDVDQVIYVSAWARRVVETERGIVARASTFIPNGIADLVPRGSIRRWDLGLGCDDLVIISVGTLEPRKNQLALLDLFAAILSQRPSARLLLVGDGPQRGAIEDRVAELQLGEAVRVLGRRSDVPELLAISDLYLHYALLENCPVVLIECARAGLPFAAAPTGGIPELQERLGVNVPLDPSNVTASMGALRPLLDDAELRRELGRRARAAFLAGFTTDAMAQAYLSALSVEAKA